MQMNNVDNLIHIYPAPISAHLPKFDSKEHNHQHGAWFVLADVLDILDLHIVQRQGYANLTVAVEYITKATLFSIFTLLLMLSITHSTSSKLASEYRYRFLIQEELLQISDKEARALVTPQRVHSFVIENLCPSFVEMLMLDPTWTHRGRNDMMTARRKYRLILGLSPLRFRYEGWRTQSPTRVKGAQGLHQKNVTPEAQKSSRSKGETSELTMSDLNIPVQELQSDAVKDKNHSSERENGFSAAQNQGPEVLSGDDDDDEGNQPMLSDESDLSSDHDEDEDGISESIFVKEELSLPNDIMRDAIAYHDRLASVWNTEKTKKSDLWPTIHELYENYLDTAKSDVIPRNALSQLLDEPDSVYSHYISGTQSRNDSYRSSPKHDPPHWESEDSCAIDGKDATPWLEALCRDNLKRIKGMTRTSGDLLTIDMVVGNFHTDIAIMAIPTFEIRVLTGGSARVTLSVPCFVWDKRIHVLEHIVFAVAILQLFITLSRMIIRWFYQRPCIPCSQRVSRALYKHVKYQLQGRYECIVCDRPFDPAEYRRCPNCGCITGDHPHVCALWFHTFRWVNFMYMILCSLIIMAYAMHTRIIQQADRLDKNLDANNEMDGTKTFQFFFVKELTQLEDIRRSLLAVAVLVAFRVLLYYITYAETMARGIRILTLAVRSFTGFFLTVSIAFVGFMLALHTMLGPYDESFRTIEAALLSSAEMILYKDYMKNAVHAGQQSRNGVVNFVCFSFQLISYLIVLNVLIALVKQAFWIVNRLKPPSPLTQSLMQLWMFLHGHRVSTSVEIVQEFYAQLEEQNNKQKNREIIRHVRWKMSSLEPNQMGAGNKLRAPVLRSASPVFTVRKEVSPTFVSYTSMRADSKAS